MLNVLELSRIPTDPASEIDVNLREIEILLFSIAQSGHESDALTDIVKITHARGLRALARLTPGEIEQVASSVMTSFRPGVDVSDVADNTPPPTADSMMARLESSGLRGRDELAYHYLLTIRAICDRADSPEMAATKCGLTLDEVDAVTSPTFAYLRVIASELVTTCRKQNTPLFELRYPAAILPMACQEPELFAVQAMARMNSFQPEST